MANPNSLSFFCRHLLNFVTLILNHCFRCQVIMRNVAPPHLRANSSSSYADNDEPQIVLSSEAWLFRIAKSYQEYMKLIPVPTTRDSVIPFKSWVGLGSSIKKMYNQPLHYLTNIQLKRMDQARLGAEDAYVPLDMIIHPVKAEATIWLIEDVHRRTSSPHHLLQLWEADSKYHAFIDAIYPKLEQ